MIINKRPKLKEDDLIVLEDDIVKTDKNMSNNNDLQELEKSNQIAMHFVDSSENSSEMYPINPNGSPNGITGITASNGRVTIMMPHPERVFRKVQLSWHRKDWNEYSPWMQIFINAKKFSDKN